MGPRHVTDVLIKDKLVVQWLRLLTPNAGGPGSKSLHTTTKTQCSQINFFKKGAGQKSGHTDTQGEGHVMSKAKVGVMLPQAKECPAYRQPPEVRRLAWDRLYFRVPRRSQPAHTLVSFLAS